MRQRVNAVRLITADTPELRAEVSDQIAKRDALLAAQYARYEALPLTQPEREAYAAFRQHVATYAEQQGEAVAKAEGMAGARIGKYPGAVGVHPAELVEKNVEEVLFGRIVDCLTRPVAADAAPAQSAVRGADTVVFEGSFEEVNAYFRAQEWTDGLPVIPPTRERIEAFLKHTDRKPFECIAVLPQANLEAVPWNIAANAVDISSARPIATAVCWKSAPPATASRNCLSHGSFKSV